MLFVKNKDGHLMGEQEKMKERWSKFICELLEIEEIRLWRGMEESQIETLTKVELEEIIRELRNNKSPR